MRATSSGAAEYSVAKMATPNFTPQAYVSLSGSARNGDGTVCGIGGCVVAPGDTPDRDALKRMLAALEHRGPDDRGLTISGNVGLVHARLAIVDPSPAGRQPMAGPEDRWLLTYNGEVFNHLELRDELGEVAWHGGSDTETLLVALDRWGEDAIDRCNGLFAYAALDTVRRRLLLVRDRFGVKPLYRARHQGALWFASEIGALLAAGVPRRAHRHVLAAAVSHSWVPGTTTPVAGVERVAPGTVVSVDLDTLETTERRWFAAADLVDPELGRSLAAEPRERLAARLEDALRASVHRRLMADVPLGTMCSGGLDSTLITALAAEQQSGLVAFNASLAIGSELDEGGWARRAAGELGVELETIRVTPASWQADLVRAVRHFEYPLVSSSAVAITQIAAAARRRGVKVLLTGEAADELFGGYVHRHGPLINPLLPPGDRARRAAQRIHPDRLRMAWPGVRGWLRDKGQAPPPFPRWPGAVGLGREQLATARRAYSGSPACTVQARLLADLARAPLPQLLNRMDKSLMAGSVEARVPFLDPEVVALALNLPPRARLGPLTKGILRDVGARLLGRSLARRPKYAGMGTGSRLIERRAQPEFLAAGHLRELLGQPNARWRQVVAGARGERTLWLWSAEIWARAVLDGQNDDAVATALWKDG